MGIALAYLDPAAIARMGHDAAIASAASRVGAATMKKPEGVWPGASFSFAISTAPGGYDLFHQAEGNQCE